jgi:hypothetical protein
MASRAIFKIFIAGTLLWPAVSLAGQAAQQAAPPTRLLVCEAANDACTLPNAHYPAVWNFDGMDGTANLPNGSGGARLTIEQFDGQTISVRRFDRAGATAGLSGLYSGTIEGNRITGTVKWSWLGHPDHPSSGMWVAVISNTAANSKSESLAPWPASGLPPLLLECEGTGPCNAAWQINGAAGTATWFAQNSVRAKLTVVRSDADDILIRRTDTSDGNSAVYAGARHGNQVSGTVIWSSPGHPGASSGTWSASIPQTVCEEQANLSSKDALRIGQNALMFHREHDALGCYIAAAKTGDAIAEMAVGLIYYHGQDTAVPQDLKQALFWLRKAADHGVYGAQKTVADMYILGQGTPRDPELSRFYAAKAAEQKRDWERQQDRADRAAGSAGAALTGFVMGSILGALFF